MKSKMTMKKGAALCVAAVMACAALAGCSKKDDSAQSGASSAATSESSTEILDNSKLTEMPDAERRPDEDYDECVCRLHV